MRRGAAFLLVLFACAGPRGASDPDAATGVTDDAGDAAVESDAGDAGLVEDAGTPDAGMPDSGTPDAGIAACDPSDAGPGPLVAARPYTLHVPAGWHCEAPAPLLLMFHGYGSSGADHEAYLKFTSLSDKYGFLYAYSDGTRDTTTRRFWEGTDACCDIFFSGVNDVAYTDAVLDDIGKRYPVDPKRIYAFGHSNGGFMVHRLACDRADRFAAVVSLAGAVFSDASKCVPYAPIAVVQIHGDADQTISYTGGRNGPIYAPYPSAHDTVAQWAAHDRCSGSLADTGQTLDISSDLAGSETIVAAYPDCPVELWTIHGGPHMPNLTAAWAEPVWAFFAAHPKP